MKKLTNLQIMVKKVFCCFLCLLITLPGITTTQVQHPWQGKRVAYLGDSITDPKNKAAKKHYWAYLQEMLGITPYVYAVSGRQWNDIPRQAEQLKKEHNSDFDAIMIFIGTNDYNAGVPIGEWYTQDSTQVLAAIHKPKAMVTRMKRTMVMDENTYRGRINIALSTLKKMFPTKQIVLLTPIHRAIANFNDKNIQPTEEYQNECGEYLDRYVNSVKEAGNIWAVPVIDLNSTCGLYPILDEYSQYFHNQDTDRLHPNDAGHVRIAKTLFYQLLSLPCTFE